MNRILKCGLPLAASLFFVACATKKVTLDPVTVNENAFGATIYHGSYSKDIDIIHTRLDLRLDWDSTFVIGKAYIDAKPYFYPSDKIVLNAKGFRINRVGLIRDVDSLPLKYTYDNKLITIKLDKTYKKDQKFTVFIDYVAMPNKLKIGTDIPSAAERGFNFINPNGSDLKKPQQFWTQGETENNSTWFPTIDGPQEKMTQEISLTVAKKFTTLSNGSLDFSMDNGDGTRTDIWRQDEPHSTYLTMVAGGEFTVVKDKWEDKEVNYYMEPAFAGNAKLIFGKTPEMISFFSKKLGYEFPWEKYSQIVVRDFNDGAMENTTATVFFERMNMSKGEYLDENHEDIISHELFHHWFGDLVTAESWSNLPLNESFATYGEYLWNEYKYGRDYADFNGWNDQNAYLKSDRTGRDVIRFDYADREHMFDVVSYQKGGRILHMLRKTVGDDAFFKALNLYLNRYAFKTAEIHDLRLVFEEVTGQDLNWFFNQWFLASGHPVLNITTSYDASARKTLVTVKQEQQLAKVAVYRLPFAIDIYMNGKAERHEVVLDKQSEIFSFDTPSEPQLVNVDADKYLLAEKTERKSIEQYAFQYKHAPLFADRFEAINALQRIKGDKLARQTVMSALKDQSWRIRLMAVNFVVYLQEQERAAVYDELKATAINDERSYVRAAAITVISRVFKNADNAEVWNKAKEDIAPSVIKALGSR